MDYLGFKSGLNSGPIRTRKTGSSLPTGSSNRTNLTLNKGVFINCQLLILWAFAMWECGKPFSFPTFPHLLHLLKLNPFLDSPLLNRKSLKISPLLIRK